MKILRFQFLLFILGLVLFPQCNQALANDMKVLTPTSSWEKSVSSFGACNYQANFEDGHIIAFSAASDVIDFSFAFPAPIFDTSQRYLLDIHTFFAGSVSFQVRPATPQSVALTFDSLGQFEQLFAKEEEISLGVDDQFYIFELYDAPLPLNDIRSCLAQSNPPQEAVKEESFWGAVTDTLNPFSSDEEVSQKTTYNPSLTVAAANPVPPQMNPPPSPSTYSPFLTASQNASPPANAAQSLEQDFMNEMVEIEGQKPLAQNTIPNRTMDDILQGAIQQNNSVLQNKSAVPKSEQQFQQSVVDLNNLLDRAYPASVSDLRGHLSDKNPNNEDAELVNSLLRQLALLEREKEALRLRVAEAPGPLSVIRSCKQEKQTISSLQNKLDSAQLENSDLQRQNEVNFDLAQSCQALQNQDLEISDVFSSDPFEVDPRDEEFFDTNTIFSE